MKEVPLSGGDWNGSSILDQTEILKSGDVIRLRDTHNPMVSRCQANFYLVAKNGVARHLPHPTQHQERVALGYDSKDVDL